MPKKTENKEVKQRKTRKPRKQEEYVPPVPETIEIERKHVIGFDGLKDILNNLFLDVEFYNKVYDMLSEHKKKSET